MNRSERIAGAIIFTIGALCLKNSEAGATDRPSFSNPVQCNLGENCWVQNLVDFDNGPAHSDPFCGPATYNGHKGTDIRVATIGELQAGIPVRAMADGIVLGLRNTMPDRLVENGGDIERIKGKECGNGVFIAHPGNGNWSTQYCHMQSGSIRVSKGQQVKRGDVLGFMGLSGHSTFPHLHVSVRKGKEIVDPITGRAASQDCKTDADSLQSLWDKKTRQQIQNASSAIIASVFSSSPVDSSTVMKNSVAPATRSTPIIFYATFINVRKGDRVKLTVNGSNGFLATSPDEPFIANKAQATVYTGRRTPIKQGDVYKGTAKLVRNGRVIAEKSIGPTEF